MRYACGFCFSTKSPLPTAVHRLTSVTFNGKELVCYDYDGYGDLTAIYGRDGKKLRGFAYRNHIMVEHSQPDGLVSRYEYDRYDTNGKVLKSSSNLGEEWTFDYRKDHTVVTDTYNTTATTPWHRYATGPTKTAKIANKPTTSTATKSASRARTAISSGTVNTPPGVV